ncbi:MAG: MCE family protein [Actinomycetota bacterium]
MKSFRERRPRLVGITSIVIITIGLYFAFSINRFEGLKGVYTIHAELVDAAGLRSGNEVRIAGVKIGQVTGVTLGPRAAVLEMEIEDDVRIPADSRLEVKLKTILGQKFVDLVIPRAALTAARSGGTLAQSGARFLEGGDVIPLSRTKVPFEIHQAATEGTRTIEKIDKRALRRLVSTLATTIDVSKEELGRALDGLDDAGAVLETKNSDIRRLLGNTQSLTGTLASSGDDIEALLVEATDLLGVLAERRATTSSLLVATDDLSRNLGELLQVVSGSLRTGSADLNSILIAAQAEIDELDLALAEFGTAQEMFGQNIRFGRFLEGHVCALTTANTCIVAGSPEDPGIPEFGQQPGSQRRGLRRPQ